MENIFNEEKYKIASDKCLEFLEGQMNVNNFQYQLIFAERYDETFAGGIIHGTVEGLDNQFEQIFPKYINVENYYNKDFKGVVKGIWKNIDISDIDNYGVNIYILSDQKYKVATCKLKNDGTWKSETTFRETYENGNIRLYTEEKEINEGFKEIRIAKGLKEKWVTVSETPDLKTERLDYETTEDISDEDGGNCYKYFDYFTVKVYSYADTEYLNEICKIYSVGANIFVWNTSKAFKGKKIGKIAQQLWRNGAVAYETVGIAGAITNLEMGRLPASFFIPASDPSYDKDGSNALGAYGYMLNSRSWIYGVGLALLVYTTSKKYKQCKEIMNRLEYEQNEDGSFCFSYDIYIGKLFDDYVRTGSVGWLVWGMCYYVLESGDTSYNKMISRAGEWILTRQVLDKNDIRYGLLTGGYGRYDGNYAFIEGDMDWCSIEHNSSTLQAVEGLALVLGESKYTECAELMCDKLYLTCYDKEEGRFFQGVNEVQDGSWALDCTTWAGSIIASVVNKETAKRCLATAKDAYLTTGKKLIVSDDPLHYNQVYTSDETFDGFKPYSDKTYGYKNSPDIVWSEGTLGYVSLALKVGEYEDAKKYVDECIKLQECNGSTGGVVYVTETFAFLPWEFHAWENMAATCWLYLVINNNSVLFPAITREVKNFTEFKQI